MNEHGLCALYFVTRRRRYLAQISPMCIGYLKKQQEFSYRKQIARQLRTQYVEGIYSSNYPWPWNLGQGSLKVTRNETIG